jgi:hypothetical protein
MKKFSKSMRVKRLEGLHFEFNGEFDKAMIVYDAILAKNPGDILTVKRKVC